MSGDVLIVIGEVTAAVVITLGAIAVGFTKWNKAMDKRMADVESSLQLGQQKFANIDEKFAHVEKKILEVSASNQDRFDRIENKLDRVVDHLLGKG